MPGSTRWGFGNPGSDALIFAGGSVDRRIGGAEHRRLLVDDRNDPADADQPRGADLQLEVSYTDCIRDAA